jgi:hypothetical protein
MKVEIVEIIDILQTLDETKIEEDKKPVSKIPQSMNAIDWVDEWLAIIKENPDIPTDRDTMLGWFANAIMCGWDHRTKLYETLGRAELDSDVVNCN